MGFWGSVTLPLEFPAGEKIKSITWHYNGACSVEDGGETITYEWTSVGPGAAVPHVGSILNVSWSLNDLDWSYTCTALNPVATATALLSVLRSFVQGPSILPETILVQD
uniref:Ig-like domain-containing protein n=1 Tax=Callithrix jacchus TaxID=9483 RepID=A0A8I3WJ73_CALJA